MSIDENTKTAKHPLVNIEPGDDYRNWIYASKPKLQEREGKLMNIRFNTCINTISSSIPQFTSENSIAFAKQQQPPVHIEVSRMEDENYSAYNTMRNKTMVSIANTFNKSIISILSNWNGYKPRTSEINTFKDYFNEGKRWFDIKKIDTITKCFFIPISEMINTFAQQAANNFFANRFFHLQKLYETYVYSLILVNLVEKTIQVPHTRKLFLIPAQCYAKIAFTNTGNDDQLNKRIIISPQQLCKTQTKNVRNNIVESLKQQYKNSKLKFQSELLSLHCEVDNYKSVHPKRMLAHNINRSLIIEHATTGYIEDNNCTCVQKHARNIQNVCIDNNNYGMYSHYDADLVRHNNYKNYHNANYKTQSTRYHPFRSNLL